LGSSPFARHYSGSRGFFPFLRVLRCFSSPACRFLPYGFRQEHARITTRRFPHSEIPGSTDGQLLPGAYRSRPRPSSALGAKASTVCPSSLDSKEHVLLPLWSFQGAREAVMTHDAHHARTTGWAVSQNSTAWTAAEQHPVGRREAAIKQRRGRRCSRRAGISDERLKATEQHPLGRREAAVSRADVDESDAYGSKSSRIP
jgi:hypothetical protein